MIKVESGIDLVEITRLRDLNPAIRERFLTRVYTPAELKDSDNLDHHLAGRFAAKEAATKALGTGIADIHWQDLEIRTDELGKPCLVLHGAAQELARKNGWVSWSVSISHTSEIATAIVTALLEAPPSK